MKQALLTALLTIPLFSFSQDGVQKSDTLIKCRVIKHAFHPNITEIEHGYAALVLVYDAYAYCEQKNFNAYSVPLHVDGWDMYKVGEMSYQVIRIKKFLEPDKKTEIKDIWDYKITNW